MAVKSMAAGRVKREIEEVKKDKKVSIIASKMAHIS